MPQVALFLQSFELCPLLRQPKHRLLSNMNFFLSSTGLSKNFWHLWMEWLSPQHMHLTGFEDENGGFTFLNPEDSFELLSTALCIFTAVFDLSGALTFVMNALAFGHLISLDSLSSVGFNA